MPQSAPANGAGRFMSGGQRRVEGPLVRVFRCIKASLWDDPDPWSHVPLLDVVPKASRWNPDGQWALYTSHRPDVALQEKRRHLVDPRPRSVFGSIAAAVGEPLATEVVVFEMSAPSASPGQVFDGRRQTREMFDSSR